MDIRECSLLIRQNYRKKGLNIFILIKNQKEIHVSPTITGGGLHSNDLMLYKIHLR